MIPIELKIFSHIYECGSWLVLILSAAWFFYALVIRKPLSEKGHFQFDFAFPVQYIDL